MGIYILDEQPLQTDEYTTDFLSVENGNVGEAPKCDACGHFLGMLEWLPSFQVEVIRLKGQLRSHDNLPRYFRAVPIHSTVTVDTIASNLRWEGDQICDACRTGDDLRGWSRIVLKNKQLQQL